MSEVPLYTLEAAKPKPEVLPPALRVAPNPDLEVVPFLAWQGRIRLCQPGNRKSEIVDLVQPEGGCCLFLIIYLCIKSCEQVLIMYDERTASCKVISLLLKSDQLTT